MHVWWLSDTKGKGVLMYEVRCSERAHHNGLRQAQPDKVQFLLQVWNRLLVCPDSYNTKMWAC